MHQLTNNKRATGRTTRMLADAIAQARAGRAVYVVAANLSHARVLQDMAGEEARQLSIKFETGHTLGNLDWRRMRLIGAHTNCVVLVDHHVIETEFAAMLEMLRRYDLPDAG